MNKIVEPSEAEGYYPEIADAYIEAFAGEPWNEISRCPDPARRCESQFSSVPVGETCGTCLSIPSQPAYTAPDLIKGFIATSASRPSRWYLETVGPNDVVALAAFGWVAGAEQIASEKYAGNPAMEPWLSRLLGRKSCLWVDEVFARPSVRERGNLARFGIFITGMAKELGVDTVAYRTITPQMLRVPDRDYGMRAGIYTRRLEVPDRRDFVKINIGGEL